MKLLIILLAIFFAVPSTAAVSALKINKACEPQLAKLIESGTQTNSGQIIFNTFDAVDPTFNAKITTLYGKDEQQGNHVTLVAALTFKAACSEPKVTVKQAIGIVTRFVHPMINEAMLKSNSTYL